MIVFISGSSKLNLKSRLAYEKHFKNKIRKMNNG